MLAPYLLFAALTILGTGCGRIGVELLPLDAGMTGELPSDASTDAGSSDADVPTDGGFTGNIPIDASVPPPDASADAAQDGGSDAAQDAATDAAQDAATDAAQDAATDAAQDAGTDAAQDASTDAAQDAGTDAAVDAGTDAAVDAGSPPACAGERVGGLCWYLARASTSCNDECANKGGFDPRSIGHVGTTSQGGSAAECTEIMTALGRAGSVVSARRTDDSGLGCHLWPDGTRYWLVDPPFSPNAQSPNGVGVRIVCGCMR